MSSVPWRGEPICVGRHVGKTLQSDAEGGRSIVNRCLHPYMQLAELCPPAALDGCGSAPCPAPPCRDPPCAAGHPGLKRALSSLSPHPARAAVRPRRDAGLCACATQVTAGYLAEGFNRVLQGGVASRPATQAVLRSWARRCVRLGKDSSYGAMERISQAMGFDPEAAVLATTTSSSSSVVKEEEQPQGATDGPVEGGLCALHPGLRGLEDGSALVACYVQEAGGRVGLSMNAGFESQLIGQAEALRELADKRCLPIYLWACIIAPESQPEFYASMASLLFASAGEISEISQMAMVTPRYGPPVHALARARHTIRPDGSHSALVLSLIPLPAPARLPLPVPVDTPARPSSSSSSPPHPLPPATPDFATPVAAPRAPLSRSISFRHPSPCPSQGCSPMTALHLLTLQHTPPPFMRTPSVTEVVGVLRGLAPCSDEGEGLESFEWDDEDVEMVPTPAGGIGVPVVMPSEML